MMSKAPVKDKWKMKKWFRVLTPQFLGGIEIATTPADSEAKVLGRTFEASIFDLTGDYTKHHVMLKFQVIDVKDDVAHTWFKGHELARDYMKSLIRRKSSKIAAIVNVTTKDGYVFRVTAVTLTTYRCQTSQKRAIRKEMIRILTEKASASTYEELVKAMVFGTLANEIFEACKKIYPIRKVEIYKSKLLFVPTAEGVKKAVVVPQTA
ncbi:MAG: 30S ribosomal protein S3ae [Zestosphaera tikiterensis]|uniref:Small ribosomal subunit protein eS1 n=1 Tax=Zestosphaera tikiterensis TaxID=1973259 RepID=A0A2R7Y7H8_9CREN|nr:MAG: 30S ribosomal protein S3ae [Zestosphaera tikiterensis]